MRLLLGQLSLLLPAVAAYTPSCSLPATRRMASVAPLAIFMQDVDPRILKEESLPEGWTAILDPASGNSYYWNESTGVTTWTKPAAASESAVPAAAPAASGARATAAATAAAVPADFDSTLTEENAKTVLAQCMEDLGTMFGTNDESRTVGITGTVEFVELDGPMLVVRLCGRFWHQRSRVVERVSSYVLERIPECVDVIIEDAVQLDDADEDELEKRLNEVYDPVQFGNEATSLDNPNWKSQGSVQFGNEGSEGVF